MKDFDYENEMVKIENEAAKLAFHWDEWHLLKSSQNIDYYSTHVPYATNSIFKAETTIDVEPRKLLDMVYPDGPYRLKWDPHCLVCEPIHKFDKDTMIAYQVSRGQLKGIIKERDTVDLFRTRTTKDYRYCSFASIHYDEEVPFCKDHYVRGWNYPCGIFFVPTEKAGHTKVIAVVNFNMSLTIMKLTVKIPEFILEKVLLSKIHEYLKALEKTKSMTYQPLDDLTI